MIVNPGDQRRLQGGGGTWLDLEQGLREICGGGKEWAGLSLQENSLSRRCESGVCRGRVRRPRWLCFGGDKIRTVESGQLLKVLTSGQEDRPWEARQIRVQILTLSLTSSGTWDKFLPLHEAQFPQLYERVMAASVDEVLSM